MKRSQPSIADLAGGIDPEAVRAHFPAHQGRISLTGVSTDTLVRDVPYLRRHQLAAAEEALAEAVGARATLLLTNGASQGLLVACLALARGPARRGRVALGADTHVAVLNGLVVADLAPLVIPSAKPSPTTEEVLAVLGADRPAAMVLTAPTYRGERVDIDRIAAECARVGTELVVDEVHGTHLAAFDRPSALDARCALVVHSPHKYAGALVQGAAVHIPQRSPWSAERVRGALALLDTTSRSNLIQASVEAGLRAVARGGALVEPLRRVGHALGEIAREIDGWQTPALSRFSGGIDPCKLVLRSDRVSGHALAGRLLEAGVDHEYSSADEVLLVFSAAHLKDFDRVSAVLRAARNGLVDLPRRSPTPRLALPAQRLFPVRPRAAYEAPGTVRPIGDAVGLVARRPVARETPVVDRRQADDPADRAPDARMPPGSAALMPGERITAWHVAALGPETRVAVVDEGELA